MARVHAVDSSVIVAALLGWHEQHAVSRRWLERALDSGEPPVLPMHSLLESFAVMTRLPAPHRIDAHDALSLLRGTFGECRIAAPEPRRVWSWLASAVDGGVSGGRTYDALIAESARKAGATCIVTLNPRHFQDMVEGLMAVVPG
jgi:predicted nucleic acid-binding protein